MEQEKLATSEEEVEDGTSDNVNWKDVKSSAVVKYSAVNSPARFCKLQSNTDLNFPPINWLRTDRWQLLKSRYSSMGTDSAPFTSFHMAYDFPDCVSEVDVVSDAENIKKLLKLPYSKSHVSMMVHRVGKAILLEDFDINKHILQAAKKEWEWLRKFYLEHVRKTVQHNKTFIRKNRSRGYLQNKNMQSKFLYYSIADSVPETSSSTGQTTENSAPKGDESDVNQVHRTETDQIPSFHEEFIFGKDKEFQRNVLWTFEDIRMLIGTSMPIFGGGTHPCVSLRLRDITKPINVLTGLDYWLDNLMCNVPEVLMCYHLDGIVQKYELFKTEDIPLLDNSKFSPNVIKDVAQNILSFLKSNATKAGHTYWLLKAKDDDVVKLYDLTTLCADVTDENDQNPFTVPVAMLLYRVARNMKNGKTKKSHRSAICTLLQNCLTLLNNKKHPQVVTSTHYLLSDLYVPNTLDLSSPSILQECDDDDDTDSTSYEDTDDPSDVESCSSRSEDKKQQQPAEVGSSSVEVKTLCLPEKSGRDFNKVNPDPTLSASLNERCRAALEHVEKGFECLDCDQERTSDKSSADAANKPEVQKHAKPFQPIPLHYESLSPKKLPSEEATDHPVKSMPVASKTNHWRLSGSWQNAYLDLLFQKASISAYTMAYCLFEENNYGKALKYIELSLLCFDAYELVTTHFGGQIRETMLASCAFGLAGDLHFMLVQNSTRLSEFQQHYDDFAEFEGIRKIASKSLNGQCRYNWATEFCSSIEHSLTLSVNCYREALKRVITDNYKSSLKKRMGNIKNELGVFFMSQAHSLYNKSEGATVTILAGVRNVIDFKLTYAKFQPDAQLYNKIMSPFSL